MILKEFSASSMDNRNYLIIDETTNSAALVDASENTSEISATIDELGAKLEYILLTHGHFDHVLGVNDLKQKTGAKVLVYADDIFMLDHINDVMRMFGVGQTDVPKYDGSFKDGDLIKIGETAIEVLHTPGHSEGSVSFLVDDKLFSGDTLFRESVGRTDLPGGSFSKLSTSIKDVLFKLDNETIVYPGHGSNTTIGYEKTNNEIIKYI